MLRRLPGESGLAMQSSDRQLDELASINYLQGAYACVCYITDWHLSGLFYCVPSTAYDRLLATDDPVLDGWGMCNRWINPANILE